MTYIVNYMLPSHHSLTLNPDHLPSSHIPLFPLLTSNEIQTFPSTNKDTIHLPFSTPSHDRISYYQRVLFRVSLNIEPLLHRYLKLKRGKIGKDLNGNIPGRTVSYGVGVERDVGLEKREYLRVTRGNQTGYVVTREPAN
jgi:hypothetical protein